MHLPPWTSSEDSSGLTAKNHLRRCARIVVVARRFGELIADPWNSSAELEVYNAFFKLMQGTRWINRYHRSFNASKCGDIWGHLMHETCVVATQDSLDMRSMDWVCSQVDLIRVILAPIAGAPFSAPSAHFNVACKLLMYLALNQGRLGAYSRKRLQDMQAIQLLAGYLGDAARFEEGVSPCGGPAMSPSYSLVVQRRSPTNIVSSSPKRSSSFIRRASSLPVTPSKPSSKSPALTPPVTPSTSPSPSTSAISDTKPSQQFSDLSAPHSSRKETQESISANLTAERISQFSTPGKRGKISKKSPEGPLVLKLDVLACLTPPRSRRGSKRWMRVVVTPNAPEKGSRSTLSNQNANSTPFGSEALVVSPITPNPSSKSLPASLPSAEVQSRFKAAMTSPSPRAAIKSQLTSQGGDRMPQDVFDFDQAILPSQSPPAPPPPTPSADGSTLDVEASSSTSTPATEAHRVEGVISSLQSVLEGISLSSGSHVPDFVARYDFHEHVTDFVANTPPPKPRTLKQMCSQLGVPYRKRVFGPYASKYDAEEAELTEAQDSMSPHHIDDFWANLAFLHAVLSSLGHTSNIVDRIVLSDLHWPYDIDESMPRPPGATRESMEEAKEIRKNDRIQRLQGAWYLVYHPTQSTISSEFMNEALILLRVNSDSRSVEGIGFQWRVGQVHLRGSISRSTGLLESLEMSVESSVLRFTPAQLRAFNFGGIVGGSYHSFSLQNHSDASKNPKAFGGSWMMWKALAESTNPSVFSRMKNELLAKGKQVSVQMAPFTEDMTRLGIEQMQPHHDQLLLWSRVLQKIVHPQLLTKTQISSLRDKILETASKYPVARLRRPSSMLVRVGGDTAEKFEMRLDAQSFIEPSIHAIRMQLAWFYGPYIDVDIEQLRRWNIKRALDRYYAWKTVYENSLFEALKPVQTQSSSSDLTEKDEKEERCSDAPTSSLGDVDSMTKASSDVGELKSTPIGLNDVGAQNGKRSGELHTTIVFRTATLVTTNASESHTKRGRSFRKGKKSHLSPRSHVHHDGIPVPRVDPEEMLRKMDQPVVERGEKPDRKLYEDMWRSGIDPFLENAYWSAFYPMAPFDDRAVPEVIRTFAQALRPNIADEHSAQFWASILHHTTKAERLDGGGEVEYEPILQARDVDFMIAEWNRRLHLCHVANTTDPRLTHDTILAYLGSLRADCYIDTENLGERYFGAEWDHDAVEPKRDSTIATQMRFISRKVKAHGAQLLYPDLRPNFSITANAILYHTAASPGTKICLEGDYCKSTPSLPRKTEKKDDPTERPKTPPALPLIAKPTAITVHLPLTKFENVETQNSNTTEEGDDRDEGEDPEDFLGSSPHGAVLDVSLGNADEFKITPEDIELDEIREARRRSVGGEPNQK